MAESDKKNRSRLQRAYRYRKRQNSSSIFFLLWAIFTAFSLGVVLLFGISQTYMLRNTYETEAARDVAQKGKRVEALLKEGIPSEFGDNASGYLRFLSNKYDVDIYLLSLDGRLLFPYEWQFDYNSPQLEKVYDFSEECEELASQMRAQNVDSVVYEYGSSYVYGSKVAVYGNADIYLYMEKSMDLMVATTSKLGVRLIFVAIFVGVAAFAVSSAVSGWVTKPLREVTDKTKLLARGDFDVDFHGADYGKEMVELADALNFARDELSKTDRMQKELIANVSHDFKTPLTMIKAYASMIMEISGDIPEKRNKHAQVIVDETDRLTSLVNDVLDLSKINSGMVGVERKLVDMSAYTEEVLNKFAYLQDTQGYTFVADIEEGLYTYADELKIGQVLYNLIGNAVNYTGEDKTIYVSLKRQSDSVFRFAVRDTGKGIEPEELSTVWERYYRSSEMHKRPVKGTGLGLSIVKSVLEKHGFAFGVDSKVGQGSTFYVIFPSETSETFEKTTTDA